MNTGGDPQEGDQGLMELLRRAVAEADQAPPEAVAAAKEAWTWRTIDAELAALSYDSAVDDEALVGVRGAGTVRALAFEAGSVLIEIEVTEDGDRRAIIGQVMPPPGEEGGRVLGIEWVDGRSARRDVPIDELGRFAADRLASGLIRLRIGAAGATGALVTGWVAL